MLRRVLLPVLLLVAWRADATRVAAEPAGVLVRTSAEVREAAHNARPGAVLRLAPGAYEGGLHLVGVKGVIGRPIVIRAEDPSRPPVFRGGTSGLQLTDAEQVELRDLVFEGQTGNGLNIDDGGTPETPSTALVLLNLVVRDVGPGGNCDGIKLSGLRTFVVRGCTVERWGRAGSGIDMVGCREGLIADCTLRHTPGAAGASGVQAKGGSQQIVIRRSRFEHAGGRGVNVGGSTGLAYFRPPLATWTGERFEARAITVEGCTFLGSQAPIACVGVDGATLRFNTLYQPERWALRILQETREPGFVACRNITVTDNLIVFRAGAWAEGGVNVGPGTEPLTVGFARNVWYCSDAPERTRALVRLPTPEERGVYGEDPRLNDPAAGDLVPRPGGPAAQAGAHALP